MSEAELFLGIMSGTSLDGIDVALVDFSQAQQRILSTRYQPFGQQLRQTLLSLNEPANNELHLASVTANELASLYADAVNTLLREVDIPPASVRAIGCHGQTIRHNPAAGYTVQTGNSALLAELTGITVVSDFRSRDIAAGGQGAPLVPAFHDRVLRHPAIHRVIVNIGGISNLTNLAPGKPASGFDCGPGNLLMDAWSARHLDKPYDAGGAWARSGTVQESLLRMMLAETYFHAPPPKSSGRDLFNLDWLQRHLQGTERPEDVQATLLALTGTCIHDSIRKHCAGTQEIYVCGGGGKNHALIELLRRTLPECRIDLSDALGIPADWMEAIAFAWLARQAVHGEVASLPAVTGARHAAVLGAIYPA